MTTRVRANKKTGTGGGGTRESWERKSWSSLVTEERCVSDIKIARGDEANLSADMLKQIPIDANERILL
eukprot:749529-Hanusia_phi.AAC.3